MAKNFTYFIGFRYLLAKKQGFISLISFISVAGIALGVTALIVVISVMNGFHEDIRSRIIGTNAHVLAASYYKDGIADYVEKLDAIRRIEHVKEAAPYFMGQVMVKFGDRVEGIMMWGVIPGEMSKVNNISKHMIKGDMEFVTKELPDGKRGVVIGKELANTLGADLGDEVDLILDGGPCRVGIESTVLDVSGPKPRILRPGGIARTILEAAIGPVELDAACASPDAPSPSPGRQSVHYAPTTPAVRFETGRMPPPPADVAVLRAGDDPQAFARDLYAELRRLDAQGKREIWIEMPPDSPEWEAVRDRIIRATRPAPR